MLNELNDKKNNFRININGVKNSNSLGFYIKSILYYKLISQDCLNNCNNLVLFIAFFNRFLKIYLFTLFIISQLNNEIGPKALIYNNSVISIK